MNAEHAAPRHTVAGWIRQQRLPAHEKLTLLLLFDYAGPSEDGRWTCWPSMQILAEQSGLASIATVRRHIASLEEQGIVQRESRTTDTGRTTTNRVVLLAPGRPTPPPVHTRSRAGGGPAHGQAGDPLTGRRAYVEAPIEAPPEQPPLAPPGGGRSRDRAEFNEQMAAWARHHFPGVHVGYVRYAIDQARRAGTEPTLAALRPLVQPYMPEPVHIEGPDRRDVLRPQQNGPTS